MSELKPCPFCGGDADIATDCGVIECLSCKSYSCSADEWNARAQQVKWISVDDRLPKLNESVLVSDGVEIWVDFMYKSHGDGRKCFSSVEYGATHWMPLPDMPEAKK